jgi:hypothetical protein
MFDITYTTTILNVGSNDAIDNDANGDGWSQCVILDIDEIDLSVDA